MVNGKAVDSLESWVALIEGQPEGTLNIATRSGGRNETFPILGKAAASLVPPRERPMIGANFRSRRMITHVDPIEQFENIIVTTLQVLGSLFDSDSDVSIRNLSGPPGIIRVINELSKIDIRHVIWFVCLLNINLAIINLLPIPVLDGGHIAFATLAKLREKGAAAEFDCCHSGHIHDPAFLSHDLRELFRRKALAGRPRNRKAAQIAEHSLYRTGFSTQIDG